MLNVYMSGDQKATKLLSLVCRYPLLLHNSVFTSLEMLPRYVWLKKDTYLLYFVQPSRL